MVSRPAGARPALTAVVVLPIWERLRAAIRASSTPRTGLPSTVNDSIVAVPCIASTSADGPPKLIFSTWQPGLAGAQPGRGGGPPGVEGPGVDVLQVAVVVQHGHGDPELVEVALHVVVDRRRQLRTLERMGGRLGPISLATCAADSDRASTAPARTRPGRDGSSRRPRAASRRRGLVGVRDVHCRPPSASDRPGRSRASARPRATARGWSRTTAAHRPGSPPHWPARSTPPARPRRRTPRPSARR